VIEVDRDTRRDLERAAALEWRAALSSDCTCDMI
jgi:hypothetical protein